jgi:heme exporter protein C
MLGISWWKWISVFLLIYVLTRGLLVPLKPGILDVSPGRIQSGDSLELTVYGYNSFYTKGSPRVYLKLADSFILPSLEVIPEEDTKLRAVFLLPEFLPVKQKLVQASIIVDSESDGSSVIPSKLIISQDSVNQVLGAELWSQSGVPVFHYKSNFKFPYRNILYETIRNTFFHVAIWFGMFALMFGSLFYSIKVLRYGRAEDDLKAYSQVYVAVLFGMMGLLTGSLWARFTWDTWWTNDIKLNMAALSMLIYVAYLILRFNVEDRDRRARISAAYNIFAVVAIIPLIFVLPRLTDSLHPGNGGNPAFGGEDMDNALRVVFYPAVLGFILLGFWLSDLKYRVMYLQDQKAGQEDNLNP